MSYNFCPFFKKSLTRMCFYMTYHLKQIDKANRFGHQYAQEVVLAIEKYLRKTILI